MEFSRLIFLNGESNNIERFIASFGVYCAVAHLPWLQAIALATSVSLLVSVLCSAEKLRVRDENKLEPPGQKWVHHRVGSPLCPV